MSEKIGACPICGKDFVKTLMGWGCEGFKDEDCKAGIFSETSGHRITEEEAKQLLAGEEIGPFDDFVSKKNKSFTAKLKFSKEEGKPVFVFPEEPGDETDITCPACGQNNLVHSPKSYHCSCGFRIFTSIAQRPISEDEVRNLCETGRTVKLDGFKSKKKDKEFSCCLMLDDDNKVVFDFD